MYERERCIFVRVNEIYRTVYSIEKCHIVQYLVSGKYVYIIRFVIVVPGETAKPDTLTRAGN